jgi:muramoyltetrapeptide carboxypeptidase
VICSLLGSNYLPDLSGAILILEDVNEEPYRIDRMLNQLRMSGILNRLSGLIFGKFEHCEANDPSHGDVIPIIRETIADVNGPILSGLPYGHFHDRVMLPIGAPGIITTGERQGQLEFLID